MRNIAYLALAGPKINICILHNTIIWFPLAHTSTESTDFAYLINQSDLMQFYWHIVARQLGIMSPCYLFKRIIRARCPLEPIFARLTWQRKLRGGKLNRLPLHQRHLAHTNFYHIKLNSWIHLCAFPSWKLSSPCDEFGNVNEMTFPLLSHTYRQRQQILSFFCSFFIAWKMPTYFRIRVTLALLITQVILLIFFWF